MSVSCKRKSKKVGIAIFISEKIDFKMKMITRDRKGFYTRIKVSIQEENITIINIYGPNIERHLNK